MKQNLWLENVDLVYLHDDISTDIDIAMAARRDGVDGEKLPPGILTFHRDLTIGRVIKEIEKKSEPWPVELGLELLKLGSDTVRDLSLAIDRMAADAVMDGQPHDTTIGLGSASSGITVHCTDVEALLAAPKLKRHCELRKYSVGAANWYGLAVSPVDAAFRFSVVLDYPWQFDEDLETVVRQMPKFQRPSALRRLKKARYPRQHALGRNVPCSCGSGLKYKNCCLARTP